MLRRKKALLVFFVGCLIVFFGWRFTRPMNIFIVSERFASPIETGMLPEPLTSLHAEACGTCHETFYAEWQTTIHSQAWTDPYFQTDWRFEHQQDICRNCHTPLDHQNPKLVLGFQDADKHKPITEPNPDFDIKLQHEGVTCTACHLRNGKILGPFGDTKAPHPVEKLNDPNEVCVRCHVVDGDRWDNFYRYPPCGTVAEIGSTPGSRPIGRSGELAFPKTVSLGCVQCHMPLVDRPLVAGGEIRSARKHLWRGGHDPEMVKNALHAVLLEEPLPDKNRRRFSLTMINTGAAHLLPTGTPDRHITVRLRVLGEGERVIDEQHHVLQRKLMWRPFIIDLADTRLPRWQPRSYSIEFSSNHRDRPQMVEAVIRYHLMHEKRRQRIAYENKEPIDYEIFRQRISLADESR